MLARTILTPMAAALVATPVKAAEEVYVLWGNPQAGREVYVKKGCGSCHSIKEVGGTGGPELGRPRPNTGR